MSKTGTDPNKILMGDLKPELAAKADKLSSKFAPKTRKTETVAQEPSKEQEVKATPVSTSVEKSKSTPAAAQKQSDAAPAAEETLVQMNIRIPVSLKRDIDKIVFEKKYAGEDANIKSLVSQWIQDSVKKELRKHG